MPDTVLGTEEWSSECLKTMKIKCSSDGLDSKESACNLGDLGVIPGLGSSPGRGNGSPLWYLCLENPRTDETSGLQSMGSQRVRHDFAINTHIKHNEAYLYALIQKDI